MKQSANIKTGVSIRLTSTIALIVVGLFLAMTGIRMWLAGDSLRNVHFGLAIIAIFLTLFHVAINWRAFRRYFRSMTRGD